MILDSVAKLKAILARVERGDRVPEDELVWAMRLCIALAECRRSELAADLRDFGASE